MCRARKPQIRGTFSRLFGDDPAARILDVLIVNQGHDLSLKDVAEAAGISTKTLWQVLPRLEAAEIIKHTRQVGNAKMITLEKNPVTKQLYSVATEIALRLMDKAGQAEEEVSHREWRELEEAEEEIRKGEYVPLEEAEKKLKAK